MEMHWTALLEKVILDKGVMQNPDFRNYLIPTSLDVPRIDTTLLEMHNVHGPYGAKGIGEMPNIPTPAAINNAIANAIGVRFFELPVDSESVWRAMRKATGK